MSASVPNGLETQQGPVGGLPKVLGREMEMDTTIVCPGLSKCRAVILGPDGGPYRVRGVSLG